MILKPSMETFRKLIKFNEEVGTTDGTDQDIFNSGLCPNWFDGSDHFCGRLPSIYNTPSTFYKKMLDKHQLQRYNADEPVSSESDNAEGPLVIHYLSARGKPWYFLQYEKSIGALPQEYAEELLVETEAQLMWRRLYLKLVGEKPPTHSIFPEVITRV